MSAQKKDGSESILVRMPADMVARVDEARRKADDLPTRPEMIRRMVLEWLDRQG